MLLVTAVRLLQKAFVNRNPNMNPLRINWLTFGVTLPIVIVLIILNMHEVTRLSAAFWLTLTTVVIGFYPTVNYLFFTVIRENELSDVLPLMSFTPILTALFGWVLLGQHPSTLAVVGIICVAAAIYCLHIRGTKTWYGPLQALIRARASHAMLIVSVFTAVAAIGDKYAIEHSNATIYFALNSLGAFLVLFVSDIFFRRIKRYPTVRQELSQQTSSQWRMLCYLGLAQFVNQILGFVAVNAAANTSYTIAIRNLNVVVASLLALALYRESVNRYKLLSYGLAAIGVVMIAL